MTDLQPVWAYVPDARRSLRDRGPTAVQCEIVGEALDALERARLRPPGVPADLRAEAWRLSQLDGVARCEGRCEHAGAFALLAEGRIVCAACVYYGPDPMDPDPPGEQLLSGPCTACGDLTGELLATLTVLELEGERVVAVGQVCIECLLWAPLPDPPPPPEPPPANAGVTVTVVSPAGVSLADLGLDAPPEA